MSNTAPITLEQLFRYYKALPHQAAAIQQLEQDLAINGYAAAMRRDRAWFATWSQDGKQTDLAAAIALIKEFEGCHLSAYPDPLSGGEPWTIGYGTTRYSTGAPVQRGEKINVIEADMLLRLEVDRIAAKLRNTVPHWQAMNDDQRSALVSFAYNLGAGFYGAAGFETISRCLRERSWDDVPAAMELYRNPGTNVEAGLLRRRRAEGKLWGEHRQPVQQEPAKLRPSSPFSARITPHIRLGEFAMDQEARRFDRQDQVDIAAELAAFLERARKQFGGKPIILTSGYRPPAVNAQVGGASNSEHLYKPGCGAVDFYIEGTDIRAVQNWCDQQWPYSVGYGAPKGFVHLGIRQGRPRVRWVY
jgi:GH24 family phage-related lysozyme (muramidase)